MSEPYVAGLVSSMPVEKSASLAAQVQQQSASLARPSEQRWLALKQNDWTLNEPWLVAQVLTEAPYNYMPAVALATVFTAFKEKLNPFTEMYQVGGKPAFYAATRMKIARQNGLRIGIPQFENLEREWPVHMVSGKPIMLKGKNEAKVEVAFKLPKDIGVKCTVKLNDEPMEQTAWFSICYRPSEQWISDAYNMLQIRAMDDCIRFGSGEGMSAIPGGQFNQDSLPAVEETPSVQGKITVSK